MSESTVGPDALAGSAIFGAALLAAEIAAVGSAVAATLPSGAAAVVLATDVALIITTICDPISFFQEADRWQELAKFSAEWETGIPPAMSAFNAAWQGDAATAFQQFFNDSLSPVFPLIQGLAESERDLLMAAANIILGAIVTVTVPSAALAVIAFALLGAAPASFGTTLAAQWPAAGSWVVLIAAAITTAITIFMDLNTALNQIEIQAAELRVHVNGTTGDLGGNRITPPPHAVPPLGPDITTLEQMSDKFAPRSGE